MTRKQAPKLVDGSHPSWYWLMSGGIDSVAAYLLTYKALHENYGKRPVMVYLDTRIGSVFNYLYVEMFADYYREQLWKLRTHERFEDRVAGRGKYADRDDAGPPGGGQHTETQNELKGRQRELLAGRDDGTIYVSGIRAGESAERAAHPKGEVDRGIQYVKPVYTLTKRECAEIIIRRDAPINLLWLIPKAIKDCGCLAKGDPSELDKAEELFPEFAQRLREYEEAVEGDGIRSVLGWDGLTTNEKSAMRHGQEQLTLCGDGCQRERDPVIVRAFKERLNGASQREAISILNQPASTSEVTP